MPTPFWHRIGVWQWIEFVAAIAVLFSAILAVADKPAGAIWGSSWGAILLAAKYVQTRFEKKERIDKEQLTRRLILAVLEAMRLEYFARVEDENLHQHRVSLLAFKDVDARRGLGKRLELYARAGRFPESQILLRLDENELSLCEGVAGQVWFRNAPQFAMLPTWPVDDDAAAKIAYANTGFLGIARASSLNVKSSVLSGVPIRAFGRRWGVLILDSQVAGFITNQPQKVEVAVWYADLIGRLIEEGVHS